MQIEHIALLARLELGTEEKNLFSKQLERIIEYIDKLNELDTADVAPTAHVVPLKNVFRTDELKPSLPKDKALQNAPHRVNDFYGVPKIME
ncbi:MAG TPA: Asp-tRNA(Asn)/Glu-tRNA(Gln) amidotransferase subunit GatC [Nitrospirae bacterium]|nr:glutamyl-tRNA(Gln) amidotransferase subunit C [bacterium BMS3Abin10]GBE38372.1 glutamyl-tRNA(Gln) amidotransferase subunit C [bacterium BMS3Bbin08]HDH00416.1 Asp-tRNA(Asn)/Glu-tRNA(Gln) amidotransferase subunit GatC [Nitrospirota bacterium]HDH50403.1 Asp-tRNA(Asn)/Glu-tRNA(Gln) amidotransferase subunit GatC [Nitrospirota bacterium]HDK41203.1 Asp-tRNA(Asn)/Glu-tRNA(Gln) amidotransferase subunit GatC [Nitrospirota bacterium]